MKILLAIGWMTFGQIKYLSSTLPSLDGRFDVKLSTDKMADDEEKEQR
jgi:hypothetical protein